MYSGSRSVEVHSTPTLSVSGREPDFPLPSQGGGRG